MYDKIINEIKENAMNFFAISCYRRPKTPENIESLKNSLNYWLKNSELSSEFNYPIADVDVGPKDPDSVNIKIMSAFKYFPKSEQEKIYCKLAGLNANDIKEFIYNKEGYIDGCVFKQPTERGTITITVGE